MRLCARSRRNWGWRFNAEAELCLLEEGWKAVFPQPVELLVASLCKAPEALDPVDVDSVFDEDRMVLAIGFGDAVMLGEACFDEAVVAAEAVCCQLRRERDTPLDDGLECCFRAVFHDLAMHAPAAFEDPEDRRLAARPSPRLAPNAGCAEKALVDLDLPLEGTIVLRQFGHDLLQPTVLILKGLQPTHFVWQQPAVSLLPVEVSRLTDPRLAADLRDRRAFLALLQDKRLLRLREP